MAIKNTIPGFDELFNYLIEKATPEEILAFKPSAAAQERANELLEKNSAGTLTPEEAIELERMRYADSFVSLLKAKALETLSRS